MLYEDDEDYQNLREEDKENNYLLKLGDTFIKLPRGRVASAVAGIYNRTLNAAQGKDFDFAGYLKNLSTQVTPVDSASRNIFSPILRDLPTNTTWYGTAIEGQQFENMAPEERYDEGTSSIAIALGKVFKYSPKKIHYLLDQYSGVIGDFILPATTERAEKDYISAAFTLDPATSNKISTSFYKVYDELTYKKDSLKATAKTDAPGTPGASEGENGASDGTETEAPADDAETAAPTDGEETEAPEEETEAKKGGCGSSIALSALAVIGVVGTALVIKKKED
jgi:hypothetical protein